MPPPSAHQFDAVIVGAGQSGPSLAQRLAAAGQSVAFVERKLFGGTCVNTGCTPTKAMVASARVAHFARRAADYGVELSGPVRVDLRAVKARKDRIVEQSASGVEKALRGEPKITVFHEHARFESPRTLRAGEHLLTAGQIFLDVGGRAAIPEIPGLREVPFLTNSTMMELEVLPDHLIILGGSYIALEFGQMFRRFGSEVTILERGPRIVSREDEDISAAIHEFLTAEGLRIETGVTGLEVKPGMRVRWQGGEARGSHLLVATGRRPNTDDLGLERAGVKADSQGYITVDDQLRTTVPGIWALGDCNGKGAFTHTSYNDYEIVAANLLDHGSRRVSDRIPAYNIYIDPPLGRCGMTEAEARRSGRKVLRGIRPMSRVSRAIEKGETNGFLKILADAESEQLLGASLLGVECDEVIHSVLDLMYARASYNTLQRAMHIHPTVSELLPTVAGSLQPL